jgi:Na+/melibiose symporter and related transporters
MAELSWFQKIGYSVGALGMSLVTYATMQWVTYLYAPTRDSTLPMLVPAIALMGVAMAVGRIVDAVADPLVGFWSDRTRTRWGRRKPFIVFGSLPLAISFMLIWSPLRSTSSMANFFYITLVLCAFFFLFTVVICPYLALLPEIATSSEQRISLSACQAVFNLLGLAIGLIGSSYLIGAVGFFNMGLILGIISLISFYIPVIVIKERTELNKDDLGLPFKSAFIESFRNRPFVFYIIAMFFMFIASNILIAVVPYFTTIILHEEASSAGILSGVLVLVAMIFFPVVTRLSNLWGKKKVMLISIVMLTLFLPLMATVGHTSLIPLFYQGVFCVGLIGIPLAAFFVLPYAILADITDYDEQRTGYRREAMYFGMQGLVVKGALGLSSLVLTTMLETFGYSTEHPLGVVLCGPVAAVFMFISLLFFWKYPLE